MADFFRSACVPGAGDYRLNPNVSGASVLCQRCIGNEKGEHVCENSHSERYSDGFITIELKMSPTEQDLVNLS